MTYEHCQILSFIKQNKNKNGCHAILNGPLNAIVFDH